MRVHTCSTRADRRMISASGAFTVIRPPELCLRVARSAAQTRVAHDRRRHRPIHTTPSNVDIDRKYTAERRRDNRLFDASARVSAPSCRAAELPSCRAVELSSSRAVEQSSCRTVEQSSSRAVEQSSSRTVEQSSSRAVCCRAVEQSSSRAVEQSSSRTVEQSSCMLSRCRAVERSSCHAVELRNAVVDMCNAKGFTFRRVQHTSALPGLRQITEPLPL